MKYRPTSEPLIFLYTIIFTINYTVLPQLVVKKICLSKYNETLCGDPDFVSSDISMKKEATRWWFYLLCGSLFPSVFTVLVWGPVTDVIGRKRAMILVPMLNGLRALIYVLNSYYINGNVAYMIFGSLLSCFYGEFQGVVALCYAYLADITASNLDSRTMRMAAIEASLFFAGIPAGLSSGYILEKIGFIAVFTMNIGINIIILLYVLFCLSNDIDSGYRTHESASSNGKGNENYLKNHEGEDSVTPTCRQLFNPFAHLRHVFVVIMHPRCRKIVLPVVLSFGCSVCAVYGELVVETLYLSNEPFVFSPKWIGYYAATQSLIRGSGVILITRLSYHFFHLTDYTLVFVGIISQVVCYVLIGVARSTMSVFLVNTSGLAIPVATTTLRSLATKQVTSQDYGAVLGALEATDAIAGVITNAMTLWTFDLTLHSGVVFFALSSFAVLSGLFVLIPFVRERL